MEQVAAALPSYEIGEELGRGSTGVVIAARHRRLERDVAVKMLPPDLARDDSVRRRFVSEARLLASLSHVHVVPIYDFVEQDGLCLLVMERLGGGTLGDFARAGIDAPASCAAILALAAGLQHAHERGVLHRDIKPTNVLVTDDGVVKVTDFGIAKVLGGSESLATRSGFLLGTPAYMAPEQALGLDPTPATDVYGAGTLLYELLAGRPPFPTDGAAMQVLYRRVHEDPTPLWEAAPDVPGEIGAVVMRSLEREPEARQQSAAELGRELDAAATAAFGPGWARATPFGEPAAGGTGSGTGGAAGPVAPTVEEPTPRPTGSTGEAPPAGSTGAPPSGPTGVPPAGTTGGPPPADENGASRETGPQPARGRLLLALASLAAFAAVVVVVVLAVGGGEEEPETVAGDGAAKSTRPATASDWQTLPEADLARQQAPGAEVGGKIWLVGGLTGTDTAEATPTVAAFDTTIDSWERGPALPVPLHHAMAATYNGRLVVMGGWIPEGSDLNARESAAVYELRGDRWEKLPSMNTPRAAGAAAVAGDKLVVTGGTANGELLGTTEVFDGKRWKVVEDMPTPREHLAAVGDDRYFYAVGGRKRTSSANVDVLERYDPEDDSWEKLAPMPQPLGGLGAALVDGTIVAVGGENPTSALDSVFLYDIARDEWRRGEPLPAPRHGMTVLGVGDTVYAMGGATEAGHEHSTKVAEALRFES